MKKVASSIFNVSKNPAFEYIQINREKILVSIFRSDINRFTISFHYNGKYHLRELPHLNIQTHTFGVNNVFFEEVDLNIDERQKIADRLNDISDYCLG